MLKSTSSDSIKLDNYKIPKKKKIKKKAIFNKSFEDYVNRSIM